MTPVEDGPWALPLAGTAVVVAFLLAILVVCLRVFGRLTARVLKGQGKVWSEPLGLPDLLVVGVLSTWFAVLAVAGFAHGGEEAGPMSSGDILQGALLFAVMVGGITLFLRSREISVFHLFGFGKLPPLKALGTAALLFAAAYPIVRVCTILTAQWLGERAESQKIIEFFINSVAQSNPWQIAATAAAGILIAPATEEFLFRGYIYGTVRRYLGPIAAILLSSALFALIHMNLLSLPSLFVLAICFALAYEATGSLLVPMAMHAFFNALNLGEIFFHASRQ